jgi:signal transduction histidine kinase
VHTIIALKLARDALAEGRAPTDLIDEALVHAERASSELSDVVRGILPTVLVHGGLRSGLESLLADLALAAELRVAAPRLPAATETTAYLVISEALTNVARHACADHVSAYVELDGDVLVVEVRDDGVGGADPARGRGLTGLVDRVEAAGGAVTVTSPAGAGTVLSATLPVEIA